MKKALLFLAGSLAVLATSWALLHPGFFRVHDYVHATRVAEMLRGLQEGQLPVRWSANLGYGYGMPLFEFYAPLPFLVGAVLYWSGVSIIPVLKILYLLTNVLSFIGAFWLGKKLFGKLGGVTTGLAYTLAPYRAVNLYIRGALSEAWAMMALPWVLLGIVMILRREKAGFWVLLAALVTLMLSHNLTTLMFVPVSLLFALITAAVSWWKQPKTQANKKTLLRSVGTTLAAYAFAIGSTAFYLFPALAEKDFTKIESIFSGYFHYSHHFLYIRQFFIERWGYGGSNWGPDDGISFFFGYGQLMGLALLGVMLIWSLIKRKNLHRVSWAVGVAGLFGLSCFMTLMHSKFLWDVVPLLPTIQFPWRWLSLASIFLALLVGTGVAFIPSKKSRIVASIVLCAVMLLTSWHYFRPENYLDNPDDLYYTDTARIQSQMSQILPDYIPKTMSDKLPVPEQPFLVPAGVEKQVEVVIDRGHEKLFKTTFLSPVIFNPMIASFPGWEVFIDGKATELTSGGQFGTLAFEVPNGEHLVSVRFGRTPVRAISDAVSVITLIFIIGVGSYVSIASRRD